MTLFVGYTSWVSAQTLPAPTQTGTIVTDPNSNNKAEPGDRIRYKVPIQNTHVSTPANGVQLNVVPDAKTTLVGGSFRTSPLAIADSYACTGNVGLNVPAANGLKANDFDDTPAALTVVAETKTTAQNGSVTINADGSFTYTPPAGYTGNDSFTYTLEDGNEVAGVNATDAGTVALTISNLLWFVDNTGGSSGGDGRLNTPFKTLADFNTATGPAVGQVIFLKNTGSNYTGGIVLKNNQLLYGTGHSGGSTLADVLPFTVATHSFALPAINGTRPGITNSGGDGITLASGNSLRGVDIGSCSDFGIDDNGDVGNLTISEVTIVNSTGGGFRADNGGGTLNVSFTTVSSTGGVNGIHLANCAGSFTVSGGTITNPTGSGVLISGGSVNLTANTNITDNSGFAIEIDNHDSGNLTFQVGTITSTAQGIRVQNCGGGIIAFNNPGKTLATGANAAVTLSSNTGAVINFTNGGLVITTTGGTGFTATGGGTITVQGTGNTINSGSGTALNVTAATIGAGNLNFQSISANGAVNGIVLNNTGTSGGLTVTGTGSANSGGTIQNCTATGFSGNTTHNLNLSYMNITANGNAVGEHGINLAQLTGSGSMTNCTVSGSAEHNMRVVNTSGTLSSFTVTGCSFTTTNMATGGDGVLIENNGTGSMNVSITGSTFTDNKGDHFQAATTADASGTTTVTYTNNVLTTTPANDPNVVGGGITINPGGSADMTFTISDNNIQQAFDDAININHDPSSTASSHLQGTISGNTIGTAGNVDSGSESSNCITVGCKGAGTNTIAVTNNTVRQWGNGNGIVVSIAEGSAGMNATVTGNSVKNHGTFGINGIRIDAGATAGPPADNGTLCVVLSGNDAAGSGNTSTSDTDIRLRQRFSTTIKLPGYAGANNDTAAVNTFVSGNNTGSPSVSSALNAPPGGGYVGGAPCLTP